MSGNIKLKGEGQVPLAHFPTKSLNTKISEISHVQCATYATSCIEHSVQITKC